MDLETPKMSAATKLNMNHINKKMEETRGFQKQKQSKARDDAKK